MRFTVLGSRGFVGSHLVGHLETLPGVEVLADLRHELPRSLGHAIYCIGLTTDYRERLHDTMEAHVGRLLDVLRSHEFDSFTYLSSTAVYDTAGPATEDAVITAQPASLNDYFKISKLAGEAVCLQHPNSTVRVIRLSHAVGMEHPPMTFVPTIIRDGLQTGHIVLRSAAETRKDFVTIADAARVLVAVATRGRHRLYNLASGASLTLGEVADCVARMLGCGWSVLDGAPLLPFPDVDITLLREDFDWSSEPVLPAIQRLCEGYRLEAEQLAGNSPS